MSSFGEDWIHYSFTNPSKGRDEPKVSYIKSIGWEGNPAAIGDRTPSPPTSRHVPEERGQRHADRRASVQPETAGFRPLRRHGLETAGYFGMVSLSTDPRWRSCSIYLFGVDMYGNTLFSRNPYNLGMGMRALWS